MLSLLTTQSRVWHSHALLLGGDTDPKKKKNTIWDAPLQR